MNRETKEKVQEIKDDLQLISFEIAQNKLTKAPKEDRLLIEGSINNLANHANYFEVKKKAPKVWTKLKGILKNRE